MFYNFRYDRSQRDLVLRRLKEDSELCQGWGGGDVNLNLRDPDFVQKAFQYYKLATTRTPSNLTRIRDFKDGDVLVTPHLPEDNSVSLHIVNGDFPDCYRYVAGDDSHLNHRIRIKDSFGWKGISTYNERLLEYRAVLKWLRYPILPIPDFDELFSAILRELKIDPDCIFWPSDFDEVLSKFYARERERAVSWLRALPDSDFEGVCERILKSHGYEIVRRNYFNGRGGDVDRVCRRLRSHTSLFEAGDVMLFVQLKKYKGTANREAVDQVVSMLHDEPEAVGCVMSTADKYDDEAIKCAESNGIVLLDKDSVVSLFLQLQISFETPSL